MKRFEYPVSLKAAEEGGFIVACRDLPPLITQGEDEADALRQAADAMEEVFATYMQEGIKFPSPSQPRRGEHVIAPAAAIAAKAALYTAMQEVGTTKEQLAKQLSIGEEEVRRLLDPHYGLKLPCIAQAIQLLGKRLIIGLEA